jgi:hypothetical protein
MSQPRRHSAVNGSFTMQKRSFIIFEHSQEKPPEGCEPGDGGFFMLICIYAAVKRQLKYTEFGPIPDPCL